MGLYDLFHIADIIVLVKRIFSKRNFFILVVLLGGVGYFLYNSNKDTIAVSVIEPESNIVKKTLSGTGLVKSKNDVNLRFNAGGKISTVSIEEGDNVSKGDYLASLDVSTLYFNNQSAQDSVDIAKRDRDLYIENYETNKKAVGGEDEYYINLRRLNELVSKAEAARNATQTGYTDYQLYAPFDGTVIDSPYTVGENYVLNSTVIRLADLTQLIFEADIDQEDYSLLQSSQKAEIELDTFQDKVYSSTISKMPSSVDTATDSLIVEFTFDNNQDILLGMTGDITIVVEQTDSEVTTLIFDQVYFDEDDNPFVWINVDNRLAKLPVELGLEGDIYTQILTDLSSVQIVTPEDTSLDLEEGMKIRVVDN